MREQDFLSGLTADPWDETLRLVYADWLEERGDPRSEFLRVESEANSLWQHAVPPATEAGRRRALVARLKELRPTIDREWLSRVARPDWMILEGRDLASIKSRLREFSGTSAGRVGTMTRLSLFRLSEHCYRLAFASDSEPGIFCNLLRWLGPDREADPPEVRTSGWLTSPKTGVRYCLVPGRNPYGGQSLSGISMAGYGVRVALPDCGLSRTFGRALTALEPRLERGRRSAFVIRASVDASSGNPGFVEKEEEEATRPGRLLDGIYWAFRGEPFATQAPFNAAVGESQVVVICENNWNPGEIVLPHPQVRIRYMCWEKGKQQWPVVELTSDNGEFFTAGELLFKIHNAVVKQLRKIDHHFFEGLVREPGKGSIGDEPPLYRMQQGS
jgi:uncharacterized protein (TIGR02996 family)